MAWQTETRRHRVLALYAHGASSDGAALDDQLISNMYKEMEQELEEVTASIKAIRTENDEAVNQLGCDTDLEYLKAREAVLQERLIFLLQQEIQQSSAGTSMLLCIKKLRVHHCVARLTASEALL
jgi:hypothetical protein